MIGEMLPALAQQHFRKTGDAFDYEIAVVSNAGRGVVYHSAAAFSPKPDARADATVDLFQVRTQDFGAVAAEVRRFVTTFTAGLPRSPVSGTSARILREPIVLPQMPDGRGTGTRATGESGQVSIIVQKDTTLTGRAGFPTATWRMTPPSAPGWRLLVKHPSGSLEVAVNAVRRRNLLISSSILAVLGASVGLLILSTRRAQELARQQMEFVAAVSHELRTPLAVIRSAGENLADGVVRDDEQIRKYGDLVRNEGRRLTEMVEQILEFAGIQSGQRGFALRPVAIAPMLRDIVESSRALIDAAGMQVEYDLPDTLPPVLGEEPALRRVFQNLIANAIKYGATGEWIGLRARHVGREVHVTVADRGIGIAAVGAPAHLRAVLPDAGRHRCADPGRGPRSQPRQAHRRSARRPRRAAQRPGRGQRLHRRAPGRRRRACRAARRRRRAGSRFARVKRLLLVEDEPGLVLTLTRSPHPRGLRGRHERGRRERPRARRRRGIRPRAPRRHAAADRTASTSCASCGSAGSKRPSSC